MRITTVKWTGVDNIPQQIKNTLKVFHFFLTSRHINIKQKLNPHSEQRRKTYFSTRVPFKSKLLSNFPSPGPCIQYLLIDHSSPAKLNSHSFAAVLDAGSMKMGDFPCAILLGFYWNQKGMFRLKIPGLQTHKAHSLAGSKGFKQQAHWCWDYSAISNYLPREILTSWYLLMFVYERNNRKCEKPDASEFLFLGDQCRNSKFLNAFYICLSVNNNKVIYTIICHKKNSF